MAVSRADKTTELDSLTGAFGQSQSAILLDFRGIKVPEVTELRRQVRASKGVYRVVKNTLARRAVKGTPFEALTPHLEGSTDYRAVDFGNRAVLLLMGNEQQGLTEALAQGCDRLVRIAQAGRADSLNLAVATAIMLYEIRRRALPGEGA